MPDRERERLIVQKARAAGKSDDFIKQAILRDRARQAEQKKGVGGVAGAALGFGKGVLSTLEGGSSLLQRAGTGLGGGLAGVVKGEGFKAGAKEALGKIDKTAAEAIIPERARTAVGTAEKIGFGVEQIAEFALPGGIAKGAVKAGQVGRLAAKVPKITRLATKIAEKAPRATRLLGKSAASAAQFGTVQAVQEGRVDRSTLGAAAIGAAAPGVGAVAGRLIKPLTKAGRAAKAQARLAETISPKLTPTGQRLARETGRVTAPTRGRIKEFFLGRKKDIVKATGASDKSATTILKEIPKANQLDSLALEKAVRAKSLSKVAPLKRELKKVILDTKAGPVIRSQWNTLKRKLAGDFRAGEFKVGSMFRDFEKVLGKMTRKIRGPRGKFRQKNMDDIWDLAKTYDKTIPDTIKNATPADGLLWIKNQAWVQQRDLLRGFIKANSKQAKKSFGIMSDLLSAADDLATQGIVTKDIGGIIKPGFGTKQALKIGGAVVGGGIIGKRLGVF